MFGEIRRLIEASVAESTLIRLLARVGEDVAPEIALLVETALADRTCVSFHLREWRRWYNYLVDELWREEGGTFRPENPSTDEAIIEGEEELKSLALPYSCCT